MWGVVVAQVRIGIVVALAGYTALVIIAEMLGR